MSTPNFETMRDFPLYLAEDIYYEDEDGSAEYDYFANEDRWNDITEVCENMNSMLNFYKISCKSGYYGGIQLYAEVEGYAANAGFDELGDYDDITNDDTQYWLNECRSKSIRAFEREHRKVCKLLAKIAEDYGLEEYYCAGIFSSGEAIYRKAEHDARQAARQIA